MDKLKKEKKSLPALRPRLEPKTRRVRQKRSDVTRKKILDAAISCLSELGYAATTTGEVQKRAKVSRGSLFHQFPSKVALMLAVVDYVYEMDVEYYEGTLAGLRGDARSVALIPVAWRAFSGPGGMAVLQVLIGSIGDSELRAELPAAFARLTARGIEDIIRHGGSGGFGSLAEPDPEFLLMRAALRGLALEAAIAPTAASVEQAVELLAEHHRAFLERNRDKKKKKPPAKPLPQRRAS